MNPTSTIRSAFTPRGLLRAAINLGNPILANLDAEGKAYGVSVDLAAELARRLGAELELVVVDTAGKAVDAVSRDEADVGFFAIDPLRGEHITFTAAYVLIEGCYLVRNDSPLSTHDEVDGDANRVVVGKGSAYDLHLSRTLQHAQIVRSTSSQTVVDTFIDTGAEVAAGVRQQLEADCERLGGLRLLPGRFMVIRQAMGLPKRRGEEAAAYLLAFVEQMKAEGFVAAALARHAIAGASVAPPADQE